MKPSDKSKTKIKLSKTFFAIEKGEENVADVVAKKRAEREAAKAEAAKTGKKVEQTDPFMGNYGR